MPPISVLIKPASAMCNMSCNYCFYCDESSKRSRKSYGFMTEETLKNIIRKTMLNATESISYAYQGGEPALRGLEFFEKAVWYQRKYNRNGIQVQNAFQTNGYAIDADWCRFFAENQFLVGLSVDGTAEIHNIYRHTHQGEGTYDRVKAAASQMDAFGVEYNILTVVHRKVAEHISDIYMDYKKKGWKYQQYIACLEPLGEVRGEKEYALLPEQYGTFLTTLFHLWYRDKKRGKEPYIRQFENYLSILRGYLPEACEQRGTCGIQYVVEADGSVFPCDFYVLDAYKMGNFNEHLFADIEQKRNQIGFIERSRNLNPECKHCSVYALCRGGCQRNRDSVAGTDYTENYFCQGYKIFLENCYKKMLEFV